MTKEQCKALFQQLAKSQGMYSRLLRALEDADEEQVNEFYSQFENCKDELDVILTLKS